MALREKLSTITEYFSNIWYQDKKSKKVVEWYEKYKDKIPDKEWMRSRVCVGWINYSLKNLYDALHKQDSKKYPTGDEMVKEVDDKIASLKKKGMKFRSKWGN